MVYSLGTDVLGAGLNGEKRLEMRYMVGCKDGGLSFCIQIRSLCYRSVRALARFVADSVAGDCTQRSVSPHYCNWADAKKVLVHALSLGWWRERLEVCTVHLHCSRLAFLR